MTEQVFTTVSSLTQELVTNTVQATPIIDWAQVATFFLTILSALIIFGIEEIISKVKLQPVADFR